MEVAARAAASQTGGLQKQARPVRRATPEPDDNRPTTCQLPCAWTAFCSAGRTAVDRAAIMPALASRLPRLCRHVTAHCAPRWMAVTLMAPRWPHLGRPWAPKSGSKLMTASPCPVRLSSQFSVADDWARAPVIPFHSSRRRVATSFGAVPRSRDPPGLRGFGHKHADRLDWSSR